VSVHQSGVFPGEASAAVTVCEVVLISKEPGLDSKKQGHCDAETRVDSVAPSSVLGAYTQHVSALKRYVMRILHAENDVEDVVQEAFMRAYKSEMHNDIQQPKSYLFRIAKHVALNQVRQKVNRPTDYLEDFEPDSVLVSDWTLEDEVLAQERLGIHCAAVATLPPRRRKVYLMRKVYGMSYKTIASSLGITVSTVEAHLVKAFRQCQTQVKSKTMEVERYQGAFASDQKRQEARND